MKIRVGILEQDQIYLSRLVQYFTTYYVDKIELSVFHDAAKFLEFIQQTKIDVLLADPDLVPENFNLPRTIIMAYLFDSPQAQAVNNIKAVFKYQRAELLYREILGLYAELDKKTAYKNTEDISPVYFFMGASGGVGTTTAAIACAASLTSYGKKVLYLNFEENGVTAPFLKGDGNGTLSDVLYAVKSRRANLLLKLESIVRKSEEGIYFYEPFTISLDAHEMAENDLKEILDTLTAYHSYDCVIVDADSVIPWKRDLLTQYAQNVFVISDGQEISNCKLEKILKELTIRDEQRDERIMSKIKVIYNRYSNTSKRADTAYQENVFGVINILEQDSPRHVMQMISKKPVFDSLV